MDIYLYKFEDIILKNKRGFKLLFVEFISKRQARILDIILNGLNVERFIGYDKLLYKFKSSSNIYFFSYRTINKGEL